MMKEPRARPIRRQEDDGAEGGQAALAEGRGPDRSAATPSRILDAAHAVFVRHGTAGRLRMQDIAREAGVNQALLALTTSAPRIGWPTRCSGGPPGALFPRSCS